MKKKLSMMMILILSMLITLCACGTDTGTDTDSDATEAVGDPVELTMCTSFNEGNAFYEMLTKMCDLIEEKSGGSITITRHTGGTLCSMPEEYSYVTSGAVDLVSFMQGTAQSDLPLWQNAATGVTGEVGWEVANYIANECEDTSSLLQAQAEAAGIHAFGYNYGDSNAIACIDSASSLEDLKGRAFGVPAAGAGSYQAFGFSTVGCETSEAYESLSRGIVDTFCAGYSSITSMKLYENCKTVLVIPATGASGVVCMNQEKWNSLSEEQQQIITEAYNEAIEYVIDYFENTVYSQYDAEITDAGCDVVTITGDELLDFIDVKSEAFRESYVDAAETAGCLDDYNLVQDTQIEYAAKLNKEALNK